MAACLLLYAAPRLHTLAVADHATRAGETRAIALRDGSTVHLDGASAVAVDLSDRDRVVRLLSGGAYFDVASSGGRPFHVDADGLTVTVHGTAFAVDTAGDTVSVSVREGLVEVATGGSGGRAYFLRAGDRLRFDRATGAVSRMRMDPAEVAAWRDGRLVIDGLALSAVAERLGRYRTGAIFISDPVLASRRITGVFKLDSPVAAMRAAAAAQNAEVTEIAPFLLWVSPK